MSTLTLTVPQPVKVFAKQRAEQAGFEDTSAYVESLISRDRAQAARAKLVQEIREGIDGPWIRADEKFWGDLRTEVAQRSAARKSGKKK